MKKSIWILPTGVFLMVGCGKAFAPDQAGVSVESEVKNGLTCSDARSNLFKAYYKAYGDAESLPGQGMGKKGSKGLDGSLARIHELLTNELEKVKLASKAHSSEGEDESQDPILHLIRIEMRSQIDPQYEEINKKLDIALKEAKTEAVAQGLPCEPTPDLPAEPVVPPADGQAGEVPALPPDANSSTDLKDPALAAAHFTMATSYQSCRVLDLPLVDSSIEDAQGVVRSVKIDSVGWGRSYTDLATLKKTHYYHRGQTYSSPCSDQDKAPLVYDYGGKPVVSSSTQLNLFKNSGGGSALGIDCSAFVSTVAGVAGHLYKESTSNNPLYTRFVSRDFIDPKKSGWNCYDSVEVNRDRWIRPGDIAAVQGHVVMVDEVGEDPFGLASVRNASECDRISHKKFDFAVIQSSPSKGSLGINRYAARDYLDESSKMSEMFVGYAKQACKSQFDGTARKPATSSYGIIRHRNTDKCQASRIQLVGESCVSSCAL